MLEEKSSWNLPIKKPTAYSWIVDRELRNSGDIVIIGNKITAKKNSTKVFGKNTLTSFTVKFTHISNLVGLGVCST